MASINMNGRQSFILNEIKNEINAGRDVTHILNVKVSNQRSTEEGTEIRKAIYKRIANVAITKNVNGQDITVKWRTGARYTSAYYHCDSYATNRYVVGHSKIVLREILDEIDQQFQNIFTNGTTGLAFLVSNPALYRAPVRDQFSDLSMENEDADEQDMEEEYQ